MSVASACVRFLLAVARRRHGVLMTLSVLALNVFAGSVLQAAGPHQATGLKIGEVTADSAVIWTRLTQHPERNPADGPEVRIEYDGEEDNERRQAPVRAIVFPEGKSVSQLRLAVPGVDGDVRVRYRKGGGDWASSPWMAVDSLRDFTRQVPLSQLQADTVYELAVDSRGVDGAAGAELTGSFRTAPAADAPARVLFTVSTGQGNDDQDSPQGFKIYSAMSKLSPSFFVHTGDIIYYDKLAKTVELARLHWQRMYSWPTNVQFHRHTASYFMRDDHDTWVNDCWPTMASPYMHEFTFRQGQAVFAEQAPLDGPTWRTARWGRDLQVWLVEGRDFRSPNSAPDGPDKTIWGAAQKQWFKETLAASDATFRVLISPTPLVGPDRVNKSDNHANRAFAHEGAELRRWLAQQPNTLVICGDRHWQYASVDPQTGLREYCCGPASDQHAGGWQPGDKRSEYHKYVNVIGGFLSATVERIADGATLTLQFHDVDGAVKFADTVTTR